MVRGALPAEGRMTKRPGDAAEPDVPGITHADLDPNGPASRR